MRKKNLSDNQQEIIETYLPEKLIKSKKLDDSMKLVLANIYRFYMYDKNIGKKSIFRTNRSFMRDIEAKDPNELHRPLTRLIMRGFITRKTGNSDERIACEYTLMPQFYEMLPDCFKADSTEVSDDFENSKVTTGTDTDTDTDTQGPGSINKRKEKHCIQKLKEPYGSRTGNDEEFSFNFNSSSEDDYSYLDGTGLTAKNLERLHYWEKIIDDFNNKKFIPVELCGICVIDNEDLYRMKEYIVSEIENDEDVRPYREHLEHQLNEVYYKMVA